MPPIKRESFVSKNIRIRVGYYWRARADAAIDITMEEGFGIPSYKQVIRRSTQDSTGKNYNKKWLVEAYGCIAA
jgi:hypothetical protein